MQQIIPTTQSYDWGKLGSKSKVAQLAAHSLGNPPAKSLINEDTPYVHSK